MAKLGTQSFLIYGGYTSYSASFLQNQSGAALPVVVGNSINYVAGATTGLDIIQVKDLCGNKLSINVTVF